MSLLVRLAIYLPVLYLIAVVIVGQHCDNARDTLHLAARRTLRWVVWSLTLVGAMFLLAILFIGW
jgi:hypothetical protein